MRIATWNVNSLKARWDKVVWWLERARPDVLLLQETKLADADAPHGAFRTAGYERGDGTASRSPREGRWPTWSPTSASRSGRRPLRTWATTSRSPKPG
jgi:hypothetical protein